MAGKPTSAFEELVRGFENRVFAHMHPYELYRKWLEAVWAFLNSIYDPKGFRDCLDRYTHEQGLEFGRLLGLYVNAVDVYPFRDILGEIFMQLDVNSARSGQYFTPMSIAEMMARMQFDRNDFERLVAEKGFVTVCDPAVGSGVMLLAYAKVVHETLGRSALSKVRFYGTDIDERCVNMCRIQIRLNGMDYVGRITGMQDGSDIRVNTGQLMLPGIAA